MTKQYAVPGKTGSCLVAELTLTGLDCRPDSGADFVAR